MNFGLYFIYRVYFRISCLFSKVFNCVGLAWGGYCLLPIALATLGLTVVLVISNLIELG